METTLIVLGFVVVAVALIFFKKGKATGKGKGVNNGSTDQDGSK